MIIRSSSSRTKTSGSSFPEIDRPDSLALIRWRWNACQKCALGCMAFRHCVVDLVPHTAQKADVLFVGEGPGRSEDALGKPFVGKSGRLLRKAVASSGGDALNVAFSNLVACRPTDKPGGDDRSPVPEEIASCAPRLEALILILEPKVVVAVGTLVKDYLVRTVPMDYAVRHIRHPSYIWRNGGIGTPEYELWVEEIGRILSRECHPERVEEPGSVAFGTGLQG